MAATIAASWDHVLDISLADAGLIAGWRALLHSEVLAAGR
jgi:hypothetical protein